MSEQGITGMEYDEFMSMIDGYIERSAQESDEMPASVFFELLFKRLAEKATETIELKGKVVNNQLILHMPLDTQAAVQVRDNEIFIGDHRIIVQLSDDDAIQTVR